MDRERWEALIQLLDANQPPKDMGLYVAPHDSAAQRTVSLLSGRSSTRTKVLLVGARGGGKSTELREIRRRLTQVECVELDLDRSGIGAAGLSAFDLLYLSAVRVLGLLPRGEERTALFQALRKAYAGEEEQAPGIEETLAGLAGFATAGAELAGAAGGVPGVGLIAAAALSVGAHIVQLLPQREEEAVPETSPRGAGLQAAANQAAAAVVASVGRPLCVLVDGLEKMNGQSARRFRAVFEETRLLLNAPWAAVYAAPPCTFSETNAAQILGYETLPVYGFTEDDQMVELLRQRVGGAGAAEEEAGGEAAWRKIAASSGGMPRDAVWMLERAARAALDRGAARVDDAAVDLAISERRSGLSMGINLEEKQILLIVLEEEDLPGDPRAAQLFADGRIIASPAGDDGGFHVWRVHPLLSGAIRRWADRRKGR